MASINEFLQDDHRRCDGLFAAAEEAAAERNWGAATSQFDAFHHAIAHHFAMEEEVLFPAFERASGEPQGPTRVMRAEHDQIRALLADMAQSLGRQDADGYLGLAETLLVMMQQHNLKEERILYPLSDRLLREEAATLIRAMANVPGAVPSDVAAGVE